MDMSSTDSDWWLLGGICIVAGISALMNGKYLIAIEEMGFGLVLIAVGDKNLRKKLTNLFYSIFRGSLFKSS